MSVYRDYAPHFELKTRRQARRAKLMFWAKEIFGGILFFAVGVPLVFMMMAFFWAAQF